MKYRIALIVIAAVIGMWYVGHYDPDAAEQVRGGLRALFRTLF